MNETTTSSATTPRSLEFADRLECLLELPLNGASDIEAFDIASAELSVWIDANYAELPLGFPQFLMFYFHDPDIRAKDPKYRNHQEQQVRRFVRQLRGEEPLDSQRPWWRFW